MFYVIRRTDAPVAGERNHTGQDPQDLENGSQPLDSDGILLVKGQLCSALKDERCGTKIVIVRRLSGRQRGGPNDLFCATCMQSGNEKEVKL